jgi:hypothetical protein
MVYSIEERKTTHPKVNIVQTIQEKLEQLVKNHVTGEDYIYQWDFFCWNSDNLLTIRTSAVTYFFRDNKKDLQAAFKDIFRNGSYFEEYYNLMYIPTNIMSKKRLMELATVNGTLLLPGEMAQKIH